LFCCLTNHIFSLLTENICFINGLNGLKILSPYCCDMFTQELLSLNMIEQFIIRIKKV
jgi:hypothetical protein